MEGEKATSQKRHLQEARGQTDRHGNLKTETKTILVKAIASKEPNNSTSSSSSTIVLVVVVVITVQVAFAVMFSDPWTALRAPWSIRLRCHLRPRGKR